MWDYSAEKPPGSESCNGFGLDYFENRRKVDIGGNWEAANQIAS
jgi:hypothetical protein